jgi:hypothetical protein
LTKFKFILDDTSNFPPLVPIQEVSRTYFVSRYFIGRKDFRNFYNVWIPYLKAKTLRVPNFRFL